MNKLTISLCLMASFLALPQQSRGDVVWCSNCSSSFLQDLERVTNLEQLKNMMSQYQELIEQTKQQIQMVKNTFDQLENMVQNTVQLPQNLINELRGNMTRLANLSSNLKTQRGDIVALGEVFRNIFPEQGELGELAGADKASQAAANAKYREAWDNWSKTVDQAAQATFQLSGQQLDDLQKDPERFQQYIDNLLSTPDGQQKAIMAGNQLSALQVQEARQLRELMATSVQASLASQMKEEKESQMRQEEWRELTTSDKLLNAKPSVDPF